MTVRLRTISGELECVYDEIEFSCEHRLCGVRTSASYLLDGVLSMTLHPDRRVGQDFSLIPSTL